MSYIACTDQVAYAGVRVHTWGGVHATFQAAQAALNEAARAILDEGAEDLDETTDPTKATHDQSVSELYEQAVIDIRTRLTVPGECCFMDGETMFFIIEIPGGTK